MRNFINLSDIDKKDLRNIVDHAKSQKEKRTNLEKSAIDQEAPLVGKTLILIFEQSSTRTRLSMEIAGRQLGMHVLVLNPRESHLGKGDESIRDTCKLLNEYGDICVLRTQRHSRLVEFAEHLNIPIINGLTGEDGSHPVQILGDVQSYEEVISSITNKNISYLGDGSNNIATSLIHASEKFGFNLRIACPKKYGPNKKVLEWAKSKKANILITQDLKEAVLESSCVYTDKWLSMHHDKSEKKKRKKLLKPYQVNKKIMKYCLPNHLFFHCLPRSPDEVTDEIFYGKNSHVWLQAVNRIHIQKSILTYCLK